MNNKKTIKVILGILMALPIFVATEARADSFRSNHYHRSHNTVVRTVRVVRPAPRVVYAPRPVYRSVYRPVIYPAYRPVVYQNGIRAHYHYGYDYPCYDTFHTTGIYWNVGIGTGGWGIGIRTGW